MAKPNKKLNNIEKIATFLISIGSERSSKILKQMRTEEVEKISLELSKIKDINQDTKKAIIKEVHDLIVAEKALEEGGLDYATEVLTKTLGKAGAESLISKLREELESRPFTITRKASAKQLLNIIQNENPQIIALILSYLEPEKASEILSELSDEMQLEVSLRIARMSKVAPEFIEEIESFLENRMSSFTQTEDVSAGGNKGLAQIINRVDRATERNILEYFQMIDPSLAESVKAHLFVFDDIAETLDIKAITKVVSSVSNKEWALALKHAYPGVPEAIFKAMSERQKNLIQEEMELMGAQPLKDVEKAQKHIVEVVRNLEVAGEITISRADEVLV